MKFVWSDEYSVGVQIIDEQHRHFFDITNDLIDLASKENVLRENLLAFAVEMGNYAFYHFNTEENFFHKFNYDEATEHIEAHDQYRAKINDYLSQVRDENNAPKALVQQIADFSESWLLNHIKVMDRKYTYFFNTHGLV